MYINSCFCLLLSGRWRSAWNQGRAGRIWTEGRCWCSWTPRTIRSPWTRCKCHYMYYLTINMFSKPKIMRACTKTLDVCIPVFLINQKLYVTVRQAPSDSFSYKKRNCYVCTNQQNVHFYLSLSFKHAWWSLQSDSNRWWLCYIRENKKLADRNELL